MGVPGCRELQWGLPLWWTETQIYEWGSNCQHAQKIFLGSAVNEFFALESLHVIHLGDSILGQHLSLMHCHTGAKQSVEREEVIRENGREVQREWQWVPRKIYRKWQHQRGGKDGHWGLQRSKEPGTYSRAAAVHLFLFSNIMYTTHNVCAEILHPHRMFNHLTVC